MARPKKKLTLSQQYDKELQRVSKHVERLREQGYEVDTSIIPKKGQRVSQKKLKAIKSIKPKQLKERAYTYGQNDEKISYAEYEKYLQEQPQNQYPTISIIDNIKEQITDRIDVYLEVKAEISTIKDPRVFYKKGHKGGILVPTEYRKNRLIEILDNEYLEYGNAYLEYLHSNMSEISTEVNNINNVYYEEEMSSTFVTLGSLLKGEILSNEDSQEFDTMSEYY